MLTNSKQGENYDIGLLLAIIFLTGIGILMVYSTSSVFALEKFGDPDYFLKRHSIFLLIGLSSMILFMNINYRFYKKIVYPAYVLGLVLLVLVLIPGIGREVGGAQRWIDLDSFSFQPSEISKYIIVLYLAHSLTKKKEKMDNFIAGFASHIIMAGMYVALILVEPDFGMAFTLLIVIFAMMFVGEVRLKYVVPIGFTSIALLVVSVITRGYRMDRIQSFLDPWQDPLGSGYQAIQSFIAIGIGGIYGSGLGDSTQKLFFLPQAHTDFIFSIIGEELGLIGLATVICLFAFLFIRSIRTSLKAQDLFGCYLAFGLIMIILMQAAINMGVAVGMFPTKGIALPFISYGGTSLITSLSAMGVILNISKTSMK